MKVEVLYIAGCPSHPAAVKLIKDVLAAKGVTAPVEEVLVRDGGMANQLRFIGSPTIRINGKDAGDETETGDRFALACRLYPGSKQAGLPSVEWVLRAVTDALRGEKP